jgi:hypothetical protein
MSKTIQFTFCRGFYPVKTRFAIVIFGIYAIEVEQRDVYGLLRGLSN